jgi:putative membrane protein
MSATISALRILCFVLAMEPLQALAQTPTRPWWWDDGYAWPFWWICPLMMLFMIVVFGAVFFMLRKSGSHSWQPPWRHSSDSALEILSERYARGEIQRDEYEEKKGSILSGR